MGVQTQGQDDLETPGDRVFLEIGHAGEILRESHALPAVQARAMVMPIALVLYGVMSVVTFIAYGLDKRAAALGRQRTRERTLHVLDLLGGFPGGFAAQRLLRHKTRKRWFNVVFWFTVAVHATIWTAVWWRVR
jgi:uncharacterized membrane protein YsdA (DUF1294 family)